MARLICGPGVTHRSGVTVTLSSQWDVNGAWYHGAENSCIDEQRDGDVSTGNLRAVLSVPILPLPPLLILIIIILRQKTLVYMSSSALLFFRKRSSLIYFWVVTTCRIFTREFNWLNIFFLFMYMFAFICFCFWHVLFEFGKCYYQCLVFGFKLCKPVDYPMILHYEFRFINLICYFYNISYMFNIY